MEDKLRLDISILTRKNAESWFTWAKLEFIIKSVLYIVKPPINVFTPVTDASQSLLTTSTTSEESAQGFRNVILNATVLAFLYKHIDPVNQAYIWDLNGKAAWIKLSNKYLPKLESQARDKIGEFYTWKLLTDSSVDIDEAWGQLSLIADEVKRVQLFTNLVKDETIYTALVKGLPNNYRSLITALNISSLSVDKKLQKLRKHHYQIIGRQEQETAMWAKKESTRQNNRGQNKRARSPQHHRQSTSSSQSDRQKIRCFLCNKKEHFYSDCKSFTFIHKLLKTGFTYSDLITSVKGFLQNKKKKRDKQRQRAHVAQNNESSSSDTEQVSDIEQVEETEDIEEICALFKDITSKIPQDQWISDTGASSHMTDQLQLFSEPLASIKRRTIKVEGGKLYSDQCSTAVMCAKDRNLTVLSKVLFVSDLEVNLMSARRMCSTTELQGSFSEHCLWLNNRHGNTVLEASVREGVYIVKWLAIDKISLTNEASNHTALPAAVEKDNVELIDCDSVSDPSLSTKAKEKFKLWHWRFAHLGAAKLQDLHKVTKLKKSIPTTTNSGSVCEVCALTKMINKRGHYISPQKSNILDLVSIDICESLSTFWAEY